MFFVLAKLFGFVALPSHFAVILLAVGTALLFTRHNRSARWLVLAPVLVGVLSISGATQWLAQPLENRFPSSPRLCRIDGILVLGGGEAPKLSADRRQPILDAKPGKYFAAVELLRRYPEARIVVAAGSGSWNPAGTHETDVAAGLLAQAGIDPTRVILETKSRDTYENFVNAKAIVRPQAGERWALLTNALHMPRAVAIAQQVKFPVIPWPTDYRTRKVGLLANGKFGESLELFDNTFHEWVGLVIYRLTGRTTALLPDADAADGGCTEGPQS